MVPYRTALHDAVPLSPLSGITVSTGPEGLIRTPLYLRAWRSTKWLWWWLLLSIPAMTTLNTAAPNVHGAIRGTCGSRTSAFTAVFLGATLTTMGRRDVLMRDNTHRVDSVSIRAAWAPIIIIDRFVCGRGTVIFYIGLHWGRDQYD